MKAKLALILSFIIIVSTISYFSVINAATLSFFDDIDSSFTTNICGPTTVAQETISFILNDTGTEQTVDTCNFVEWDTETQEAIKYWDTLEELLQREREIYVEWLNK